MGITTILVSQAWRMSISPIVQTNISALVLFRQRNTKGWEAVSEEMGGERGKDAFLAAYKHAVTDREFS